MIKMETQGSFLNGAEPSPPLPDATKEAEKEETREGEGGEEEQQQRVEEEDFPGEEEKKERSEMNKEEEGGDEESPTTTTTTAFSKTEEKFERYTTHFTPKKHTHTHAQVSKIAR